MLPTLGGQTGLNLAMALHENGTLKDGATEIESSKLVSGNVYKFEVYNADTNELIGTISNVLYMG